MMTAHGGFLLTMFSVACISDYVSRPCLDNKSVPKWQQRPHPAHGLSFLVSHGEGCIDTVALCDALEDTRKVACERRHAF